MLCVGVVPCLKSGYLTALSTHCSNVFTHFCLGYSVVPFPSGDNHELHLARLKEKTKAIKLYYNNVCDSFTNSFLEREEKGDAEFEKFYLAAMELFEFENNKPFINSQQLLDEIRMRQSYMNFDLIKAVIEKCGTENDCEQIQKYSDAFEEYVKQRMFECEPDLISSEPLGHENVVFVLDRDQSFKTTDALSFRLKISTILGIKYQHVLLHKFDSMH